MSGPTGSVVLKNAKIYMGQYNISADLYKLDISTTPDMKDNTVFGASYHTTQAGLSKLKADFEGYSKFHATAANAIDGRLYTNLSAVDIPFSFSADGGDVGEVAFFMKAMLSKYNFGGSIGEMAKFTCGAEATGTNAALIKGLILEDGLSARTGAGIGFTVTMTPPSATQRLFASLHVTAFTGTDLTVKIESSAIGDFSDAVNRVIFVQTTGKDSQFKIDEGDPITDTSFRVQIYTSAGFSTANIVVVAGVK